MRYRLAAILPAYLILHALAYASAYVIRFEFEPSTERLQLLWRTLPLVLLIKMVSSASWGELRRSFRFASVGDFFSLAASTATAFGLIWLSNGWFHGGAIIPRSVICIDAGLSFILMGVLRMAYRVAFEVGRPFLRKRRRQKTLIYGVRQPSVAILRMLGATSSLDHPYRPIGFVTENTATLPSLIGGLRVHAIGEETHWEAIRNATNAKNLLIPGDTPGRIVRQLFRDCTAAGIKVYVIPTVDDLVDGRFKLTVRDLTISDLLRREPNQLDMEAIQDYVTDKRVLVTGGAGSIGSELCRQIAALKPSLLVVLDQSEFGTFTVEREFATNATYANLNVEYVVADVLDERTLDQVMETFEPELVFHAAAYKHVPLMEDNPQAAVLNNILGTKCVADTASRHGVERFVLISTDKAVRPTSVMGASKLMAEKYVQSLSRTSKTRFITVRFGNVLNSMGSVVPTFRKQIEAGGPITVTHPEMKRFFMTIPEAVQLVLQAGAIGPSGGVLILDMGEPVKIVDLAKDMIMLSGLRYPDDIDIAFSGMRPGEKLYEELFYGSEETSNRIHEKIFCGELDTAPPLPAVMADIRRLEEAALTSQAETLAVFKETVAKYSDSEWTPSRLRKAA
ncbi:MAG: polysaccharide biosynthesis protein [Planctomycetaceae bacterium]|nr:polysaccharide biosynthesis protein [Planctomycetaceae bacterium]